MAAEQTIGKLIVDLLLNDQGFQQGIDKAEKEIKGLQNPLEMLGDSIGGFLADAFTAAAAAATGLAAATMYVGANFEQAMKKVAVLTDASEPMFDALTEKARELGATTQYSATEAAEAMGILASAGMDANQVLQATGDVLVLAGAGGTDLATAADAMSASLAQFSLGADQAGRVADVFAAATADSMFGVNDLAEAMKYAGPVGASFGMSIEETVAAVAQFRDMGLQGSAAGTAFRSSMVQATRGTETTIAALKRYGLTLADINPETHSFAEIMDTVGKKGMSTTDIIEVFGTEAGGAIAAISARFAAGEENYSKMLDTLEHSTGAASAMYEDMTDTILGKFGEIQSAAEEVLLTVFDSYAESIGPFLEEVAAFINAIAEEWKLRSGEFSEQSQDVFGYLTEWLHENRTAFVTTLVELADQLTEVLGILVRILPYLDDIGIGLVTVFAAAKVAAFVTTLGQVVAAINAVGWSIRGLMATAAAATGGLYALVAAVGVLVVGLGTLIYNLYGARDATEELRKAKERLAEQDRKIADYQIDEAGELLYQTKEMIARKIEEAKARGEVTNAMEEELRELSKLTAREAAAGLEAGRLIETADGLRTVAGALAEGGAAAESVKSGMRDTAGELASVEREIETLSTMLQAATKADADALAQVTEEGSHYVGMTVETARAELERYAEIRKKLQEKAAAYAGAETDAELDGIRTREAAKKGANARTSLGEERVATETVARTKEAADAIVQIETRLASELAEVRGQETVALDVEWQARRREVEDAYAELIRQAGGSADEIARIEARKAADLLRVDELYAAKKEKAGEQVGKEEKQRIEDLGKEAADLLRDLGEDQLTEVEKLERDKAAALAKYAELGAEMQLAIAKEYDAQIAAASDEEQSKHRERMLGYWRDFWGKVGKLAKAAIKGMSNAVRSLANGVTSLFSTVMGGFSFDLLGNVQDLLDAKQKAGEEGAAFDAQGTARGAVDSAVDAAIGFAETLAEMAPVFIDALVQRIPDLVNSFAANLPLITEGLANAIPPLLDAIVQAIPVVIQAIIDSIPTILAAILEAIPTVIEALAAGLVQVIEAIPALVAQVLAAAPDIIKALILGIADVVTALAKAIPEVLDAVIDALPDILSAIIEALPVLIMALVEAIPTLLVAVLEAIPELVIAIVGMLPDIITAFIGLIPDIIVAFAEALPELVPAILMLIPEIVAGIILAIPEIAKALWDSLVAFVIEGIPDMAVALVTGFIDAIKAMISQVKDLVSEVFSGLFGGKKDKDEKKSRREGRAFAGVPYVPKTARVTVEPGEAIIPADRNAEIIRGGFQAGSGGGAGGPYAGDMRGGGGGEVINLGIYADGHLLDAVQITAFGRGHAPKVKRFIHRSSGVRVGYSRGKFTSYA